MNIEKILNGTVIDHIKEKQALRLFKLLRLDQIEGTMSMGFNLPSKKLGKKDLIKVEGRFFSEDELHQIALFAPEATISIIENHAIIKKFSVTLPLQIVGAIPCSNPQCVTANELIKSLFKIHKAVNTITLNCSYCGTLCQL